MVLLTNQQLTLVVAQLDQAIQLHNQWYKDLLRVLISHLPPEVGDLMPDAHHRCRFGQWCNSSEARFLKDNRDFVSLTNEHEKMHNSARNLLQLIMDGQSISVNEWVRFDNDLDKMRFAFEALRHEYTDIVQNRDPLTEAQTRAKMLPELREQNALIQRDRQDCAIAMFDLDHFKRINDEYGHTVGDTVLVSTVECIKALLREYDQIYRYGGEEFLICMPSTTLDEARKVAERICTAIDKFHFQSDDSEEYLHVTVSIGVTILTKLRSVEESIDCADQAMYEAKMSGRNRVITKA